MSNMTPEMMSRQQHIRWALMRALEAVSAGDWFTTLAAIDEAQIITRATQDEATLDDQRIQIPDFKTIP